MGYADHTNMPIGYRRPIVKKNQAAITGTTFQMPELDTGWEGLYQRPGGEYGTQLPFRNYNPYNTVPAGGNGHIPGDPAHVRTLFRMAAFDDISQRTSPRTQQQSPPHAGHQLYTTPIGLNPFSQTFTPHSMDTVSVPQYENFPSAGGSTIPFGLSKRVPDTMAHHNGSTSSRTPPLDDSFSANLSQNIGDDRIGDLSSSLSTIQITPPSSFPSPWSARSPEDSVECHSDESDSDDDAMLSHPNKYPVEIEYHDNKNCSYKRQFNRSGEKMKQKVVNSLNPQTLQSETEVQQIKYYQKHLVRVCRCGQYYQMDGALQQGRNNDCDGYEIHYNQKCRWKAYDDFKTGKRVLIRLCKCYKPV